MIIACGVSPPGAEPLRVLALTQTEAVVSGPGIVQVGPRGMLVFEHGKVLKIAVRVPVAPPPLGVTVMLHVPAVMSRGWLLVELLPHPGRMSARLVRHRSSRAPNKRQGDFMAESFLNRMLLKIVGHDSDAADG